jgi:hypothetical protein
LLVACHYRFLFFDAHAETGDFAANALQIRDAKYFRELYGNYSRWGFYHPGPAFFYAYAAGERLFYDLVRIVPSPFNAHLLACIMIQCGFFVRALVIIRERISHPLIIPMLLGFAALHFAPVTYFIGDSIFVSIWPPHALLFPSLCFLVACASLASGTGKDMTAAALAGSFLVHGHVAQPLFVVPCFLLALILFLKNRSTSEGSFGAILKRHKRPIIVSGAIVIIALVPIIIDSLAWEQSNLKAILQHFSGHSPDRKTLAASLTYLASFYCYVAHPQQFCDQITPASFAFLRERWHFVAGWIAILVVVIAFARQLLYRSFFLRWLSFYFVLATALTICWGMLQNGPMYSFNAHFNYGLNFVLLILFGAIVCEWLPRPRTRFPFVALWLLGLLLFIPETRGWRVDPNLPSLPAFGFPPKLADDLEPAARAEASQTKFLSFPHSHWPRAIGVALALRRLNYDYAVSPNWGFMFGRAHARPLEEAATSDDVSIWTFEETIVAGTGFGLNDGSSFIVTARPALDPVREEIRFVGVDANAAQYALTGWTTSGESAGRLEGNVGIIEFRPIQSLRDVEVGIALTGLNSAEPTAARELKVRLGREELSTALGVDGRIRVHIPRELWNRLSVARLFFHVLPIASTNPGIEIKNPEHIQFEKIAFNPLD